MQPRAPERGEFPGRFLGKPSAPDRQLLPPLTWGLDLIRCEGSPAASGAFLAPFSPPVADGG